MKTCHYCGIGLGYGMVTRDHVFPKSRGGKLEGGNRVYACPACNVAKGDMSLSDFKKTLYYRANCASKRWHGLVIRRS